MNSIFLHEYNGFDRFEIRKKIFFKNKTNHENHKRIKTDKGGS